MRFASLALFSNAIFDSVHDEPFAGGVAICGDRIEYVGTRAAVQKYVGPCTEVCDFGDKLIMPGSCEGHAHLEGAANTFCGLKVQGLDAATSEAECVDLVVDFVKKNPNVKRITGMGWALPMWGNDAPVPSKKRLDELFPDTPVYLQAADGHTCWLNTAAIKECKLEEYLAEHPDFPDHWSPRDPDGTLHGFLKEGAATFPFFFSMKNPPEVYANYVRGLVRICNSYGITGLSEVSMTKASDLAAFYAPIKGMEVAGTLTMRLHFYPGVGPDSMQNMDAVKDIEPYKDLYNSDMMHISGLKSMVDGIPENFTAAMLEPYAADPTQIGVPRISPELLNEWVPKANAMGYSVRIHCIGDRAIRMALDAFEASKEANDVTNIRNAVEHLETVDDADVARFNELGVVASFQPAHAILAHGYGLKHVGLERFKREYRWQDVLANGTHYALGTDAPVVTINPFLNIYMAVTRRDVDGTLYNSYNENQKLTLAQALKGYTYGTNYANSFESKAGTLEDGKYADIMVWNTNPFAIDPSEIKDCSAVCTIINGRVIYEA